MGFFDECEPVTESGCLLWMGPTNNRGYGQAQRTTAHRVAWQLSYGEIPQGLLVLHKCDVRCCVNPKHLFLGTAGDNTQDMWNKGRQGGFAADNAAKTHCKNGHLLTDNHYFHHGSRMCKTCTKAAANARYHARVSG